jgi:hypothetical protein
MSTGPQISTARGRKLVRDVLQLAAGYGVSEEALLIKINELARPERCEAGDVRGWLEWNHTRKFITFKFNEDLEEDEYFLTEHGRAKQNENLT